MSNTNQALNPASKEVTLTRRVAFSAGHYFWLDHWTDEDNLNAFGPVSNRNGHGHNYILEVSVTGNCDPVSGMVMNLKDLKQILKDEILSVVSFNSLNHDVPFFKHRLPTLENFARYIWMTLLPKVKEEGLTLTHIRIFEDHDMFVDYYGENWEQLAPVGEKDIS